MPYPSEHAARVKDPGLFDPSSFRSKDLKNGVRLILGKLKGEDIMTAQAYRFSVEQFTEEQAKKWLKDHKISYIKFEPAKKGESVEEKTLQHVGVLGMRWGRRNASNYPAIPRQRKEQFRGAVKTGVNKIMTSKLSLMPKKKLSNGQKMLVDALLGVATVSAVLFISGVKKKSKINVDDVIKATRSVGKKSVINL